MDIATRFRFTVGGAVLIVWFAFCARAVFDSSFHAPPEISALMLAIVGWAFTSGSLKEIGKKNGDD